MASTHQVGQNVSVVISSDKAVITVDLGTSIGPSNQGRNIMVAKTGSAQMLPGTDIYVGLNVYRKPRNAEEAAAMQAQRKLFLAGVS